MVAPNFADENGEFYVELIDFETGKMLDYIKVSGLKPHQGLQLDIIKSGGD